MRRAVQDAGLEILDFPDENLGRASDRDPLEPAVSLEVEHLERAGPKRIRHRQAAIAANHFEPGSIRGAKAGVDARRHAARIEPQHPHELIVDTRCMPMRGADHQLGFVAGDQLRVAHGITADIPQRAAAECAIHADVRGGLEGESKAGHHGADRADGAVIDQPEHSCRQRLVTIHEPFFDDDAGRRGGGGNAIDVGRIERERLLAQHMLAGGDRRQRPRHVIGVGKGNVDRVDAGVIKQRVVPLDGPRDRPLGGVLRRPHRVAAGHRDQFAAPRQPHRGNDAAVDARGAKDSPPHHAICNGD